MNNWFEEARISIGAAIRLARFDSAGIRDFNLTLTGFWRSFGASVIVAPFAITIALTSPLSNASEISIPVWSVSYILSWVVFPIAMIFISKLFKLTERYIQFIIAINWISVVEILIYFALTGLATTGLASREIFLSLNFISFIYILSYWTFVIRTALEIPWVTAIALLVIQLIIEFIILAGTAPLATV